MPTTTRAITVLCIALVSATCTEHQAATPTDPDLEAQFGKRAASLPPGTLELCKVAGPGVADGVVFEFEIALSGVTRTANVATGDCLEMTVPRDGEPLTKGYYQRKTDDVRQLVPPGTALLVDAALLSADQLGAILQAGPGVQATSSLLINLAQQLIAADLNILRGVQAPPNVLQAIADANAGIQIDPGPPIAIGTSLDAAALSALVDALTAFNEGRPKPTAPGPDASFDITETILPMTEIAAISCSPSAACSGADPAAGTVTATVTSGKVTTALYVNRAQTLLRICKEAGPGIAVGDSYGFTATGTDVADAGAADVPAGDCADLVLDAGTYHLVETLPANTVVLDIICDPTTRCSNPSPAAAEVLATVVNGLTTVTFTNRSTIGTIKVCKSAGQGVVDGVPFDFTASGLSSVDAGNVTVETGDCGVMNLKEGGYLVFEEPSAGTKVTGVGCFPGPRCDNPSTTDRSVEATVLGGDTTHVSFTNSTTFGTLEVCKTAGPGVAPGTPFQFTALATAGKAVPMGLTVAADDCGQLSLEEGDYQLTEHAVTDVTVSGIGCFPGHLCLDIDLQARLLELRIVATQTTRATYVNRSTLGTVRVCKVAGPGVSAGTIYKFNLVGTTFAWFVDVPAGDCMETTVPEGTHPLSEVVPPGFLVTDIACAPRHVCLNTNIPSGTTDVWVIGGMSAVITYTNAASSQESPEDRP